MKIKRSSNACYKMISYKILFFLKNFINKKFVAQRGNIDVTTWSYFAYCKNALLWSQVDFYISFVVGREKSCNNPSSRGRTGHESTESDFLVPMPPRGTESIAQGTKAGRWRCKNGRRRSMVEEKGKGDGEEEQFPDRDSEELGMQFSLVLSLSLSLSLSEHRGHLNPGCRSR